MFAQNPVLSSPSSTTAHAAMPRSGSPTAAHGFSDLLTLEIGKTSVDAQDEDKAMKALFRILAALSTGRVDGSVFEQDPDDRATGTSPGPIRTQLETLKAVIRRIMRGGQVEGGANPSDPTAHASLESLLQSLPSEIQNLIRRAFPNLDQLLDTERQRLLKSVTGLASQEAQSGPDC